MEELIYAKIKEYDSQLNNFEISYSNHPLLLDDVIMSYKGRNKLAKNESEDYSKIFFDFIHSKNDILE